MIPIIGDGGLLAANIMHFARVLRAAGLPIGPGKVIDAINVVSASGIGRRDDFYWTLHAVFVNDAINVNSLTKLSMYFGKSQILERMMSMVLPSAQVGEEEAPKSDLSARIPRH